MRNHIALLIVVVCLLHSATLISQTDVYELKQTQLRMQLENLDANTHKKGPKRGLGNLLLNLYQTHISVQISADCLYSLSCSRYSRVVVNRKGLLLGVLLSADRLSRCSSFCAKDIPERKYNDDGLVEDNP